MVIYHFHRYNLVSTPKKGIDYFFYMEYMNSMPSKKPKLIFVVEEELLKRLDDFRYNNRIPTRSEAIRRLLEEALKKYEKKSRKKS